MPTVMFSKNIHHILEFNKSRWLKPYIEFNKEKRMEAEKNYDKDEKAYELMNNAIYGKTMQHFKNRINEKVVTNKTDIKMYIKTKLYVPQNI